MWEKAANLMKTMFARLTFRGEPSPECWVFSSVHNRTFNYNSSYLFLYVKEHCPEIHPYYVMNDDKKREELGEKYGKEYFLDGKTMAGIRKILSCKVWFTSTADRLCDICSEEVKVYVGESCQSNENNVCPPDIPWGAIPRMLGIFICT